jgi:hypothetical protein
MFAIKRQVCVAADGAQSEGVLGKDAENAKARF